MLARALTRKGNALQKKGDLEGAVAAYSKVRRARSTRMRLRLTHRCSLFVQSLMEHRTADTLTRLNQAERQLKEQRQAAYEDPVKAEEERELGNKLFKEAKVRPFWLLVAQTLTYLC